LVKTSRLSTVTKMYRAAAHSFKKRVAKDVPAGLRPKFVLSFSDTFLICTDGTTFKDFLIILYACDSLFIAAIENRLKIRGAVTVGNLVSSKKIIIGKPIVEAYACEQNQDWMGCWITSKCVRTIPKEDAKSLLDKHEILRYRIPLKSGKVSNLYAFNWLKPVEWNLIDKSGGLVSAQEMRDVVSYLEEERVLTWDAKRKINNTKLFYEHALRFPEVSLQTK